MKHLILPILTFAILLSAPVSALSSQTLDFMDKSGIYYYNPEGFSDDCLPGLGSYNGTPSAGLSGVQSAFVDQYHNIAIQLGAEYGIPWEAVMAQGILESGAGTSRFARERNNFFGIGAFDSNPDHAFSYASPAEGWKGYFENIRKTKTYSAHGAFNYANDPYGYMEAIMAAGYGTDPNYIAKITPIIKAIQNRAKEQGWSSSSITNPGGNLYACTPSTQGNGNLNATALALSWADRTHALDDPNPAYRAALAAVGLSTYGEQYVQIGASCDAFVATVLRYSGVDPDVVCCGAANMLNYFISHPEKYEEIPNIGNSSNLQPGDIRSKPSHVEMYVVDENGNGRIASASHGDRTADHARGYYADSSYRIFRPKGGNN